MDGKIYPTEIKRVQVSTDEQLRRYGSFVPDRSILDKHETGRAESEARYLTVSDNRDVTIPTKPLTPVLIKPG